MPPPIFFTADVVSYKNFYSTTVKNTANYQTMGLTVNSIIPTNRTSSAVATNSLTRQSTVKLSAIDSPDLPVAVEQAVASFTENTEVATELRPDGDSSVKINPNAVSLRRFVDYASSLVRSHNSALTSQFLPLRCNEADQMTLEVMNSLLSANNVFGIYSESPFLHPIILLRPVWFASPATVPFQHPDPENMVRTLRDLADQKVTSIPLLAILSGAKPSAASLGFYTGYLTYSFTLELDNNTMPILVDQSRQPHDRADKYRLILRLAWATAGLYMPRDKSNPSRVLACEVLPRCLSVRVARRNVTLPDPIFHGGQAQKFGHRLRFAIDITDKIRVQPNSSVRGRSIEIDLTWLHAPLEDHALPLLEMVGSGSCTPILNHLLNLPLIQVTLDRVQPIPEFLHMFSSAVAGEPVTDPPPGCKLPRLPSETPEALVGVYDFCMSSDRVIAASETLTMVKSKLTFEDDLQSDGWIPVSLLCPLALTRIEIPVRSVNCDHLQCFDLSSYLTINKKRPRWSCPVCSSPAPFRDLRRDDFFVQLMADQSLKDAEMVHVDANGHWREASMPSESDSSAAVAAKESIPEVPSVNPTTMSVPSQLDENSTMSPSIMESDLSSEPVAPIDPDATQFSDCVVHLDDSDDDDDHVVDATQPEQPTFARPTSLKDCCAPSPPAAVTDGQSTEFPSEALDSAPTNLFIDLDASSDEEPDATVAPNSQPTPSSAAPPTTRGNCSLRPPLIAPIPPDVTSPPPVAPWPLNSVPSAMHSPPSPAAPAAGVSIGRNSSTPPASPHPSKPDKAIGQGLNMMATPRKLIIATNGRFFVQLMAEQSPKDAEMFEVDANGQWREASEPIESDSSAAVATNGSIPDNPTTATVPSLLNGTSTVSPCIMESDLSFRSVPPVGHDVGQFSDSVVHLDDGDDGNDQEGNATQPEQSTFSHPTSFSDCCAPFPPAAVTDEQPTKLPSAALDSAPTNLFIDLAANSNEEFDTTAALSPSLPSPQPTPSSAVPPTTMESCSLPAVIPPPTLPPIASGVTSLMTIAPGPLNLVKNATQPPPPPAVAADASGVGAVVSTTVPSSTPQASPHPSKPNKTGDPICERRTTLRSYVAARTAAAESTTVSAYG
ncbi:hypothetical protein AAHC03_025647 [Spirometra sp. Aus1]